jgi:hypothetical protein
MFNILTRQMDHCILTITNNGMYFMNKYKTGKNGQGKKKGAAEYWKLLHIIPSQKPCFLETVTLLSCQAGC